MSLLVDLGKGCGTTPAPPTSPSKATLLKIMMALQ